jgi:5-methylcytosine-specific restriction endonuclease McrA
MPPHYGTANGRNSLIERQDNPVCCGCGEDKRYLLCVHHIDGNKDNNVLENFEILCPTCHAKRHLYFDEKSNTWIYCTKYLTPRDKLNEV